ncbi:hypothetical protein L3Q82_025872 [Scortum barcoo]|uniref:Uncharacterized protein n=1 Tax=Scortum barcoo TaxID=214431 RepID=A0ACB8WMK0_9TELE|nr:hypothetical protein L3Q82_025872 [Scortum barcoo]
MDSKMCKALPGIYLERYFEGVDWHEVTQNCAKAWVQLEVTAGKRSGGVLSWDDDDSEMKCYREACGAEEMRFNLSSHSAVCVEVNAFRATFGASALVTFKCRSSAREQLLPFCLSFYFCLFFAATSLHPLLLLSICPVPTFLGTHGVQQLLGQHRWWSTDCLALASYPGELPVVDTETAGKRCRGVDINVVPGSLCCYSVNPPGGRSAASASPPPRLGQRRGDAAWREVQTSMGFEDKQAHMHKHIALRLRAVQLLLTGCITAWGDAASQDAL